MANNDFDLFDDDLNVSYGIRSLDLEEQPETTDNLMLCEDPLANSNNSRM